MIILLTLLRQLLSPVKLDTQSIIPAIMVKKLIRGIQKRPFFRLGKKYLSLSRIASALEDISHILVRTAVLFLAIVVVLFAYRTFKDQGYIIEAFSVPQQLETSGFTGSIVAQRISDQVDRLKEEASSVKEDSIFLHNHNEPELNLAVMGVGMSLRSVTFHLRSLFGKDNKTIGGEITKVEDHYELVLRMSGYPPQHFYLSEGDNNEATTIRQLINLGAEGVVKNTDPYRLAVVKYRREQFEEALALTRYIIQKRPQEMHWAYLAWGSILEKQGKREEAAHKFQKAAHVKSDFALAYLRLAWIQQHLGLYPDAVHNMRQSVKYSPGNIDRINNLAWLLHWSKDYEGADSAFQKAISLAPEKAYLWTNWADSKLSRGEIEEALELAEEAEKKAGESALKYAIKAMGALAKGDTVTGLKHAYTAFEIDPSEGFIMRSLTKWHYEKEEYEKVISIYRKADLDGNLSQPQQQMLNYTAMAYNQLEQHNDAFNTIRMAIEIDHSMGYPYSTLAETFAHTGQVDSFYLYLEKSFQLGMNTNAINIDEAPYNQYANDARLSDLINRYRMKIQD